MIHSNQYYSVYKVLLGKERKHLDKFVKKRRSCKIDIQDMDENKATLTLTHYLQGSQDTKQYTGDIDYNATEDLNK